MFVSSDNPIGWIKLLYTYSVDLRTLAGVQSPLVLAPRRLLRRVEPDMGSAGAAQRFRIDGRQ